MKGAIPRPWIGNKTTEKLPWSAMKAMFEERDRIRGRLWVELLRFGSRREWLLRRMVEEPPAGMVTLARRSPSPRRDLVLAQLLHAQNQGPLRVVIHELLREARIRAPRTGAAIRGAWEPVDRLEGRLLTGNMALAMHHAGRWEGNGVAVEDLVQEAAIGLQQAVARFDVGRGFKFSTYATPWVLQAVRRALHNQRSTIRVPIYIHELLWNIVKMQGTGMTLEESTHALGITLGKAEAALTTRGLSSASLDAPMFADGTSLYALVAAAGETPEDAAIENAHGEAVGRFVARLGERELFIFERRAAGDTLQEVGEKMGLSRERIRQIEARALGRIARLRRFFGWADAA